MPEVGEQAPDFSLPSTRGPLRLTDLRGKKVVLAFYTEDNTPG
ncbi:MAG: redoxin domain-containing protein [Chloroflexi bacterium]|nr:redoxin domain-containing protein [Chloroflexota bacterium]